MRTIGLSPLDKDATATFMEDGEVVFACGEERLSRVKLQSGFPERAIELGFRTCGWSPDQVDSVAYAFFDAHGEADRIRNSMALDRAYQTRNGTAESLEELRHAKGGYRARTDPEIPGFSPKDEFVARKPLLKRSAFKLSTASSTVDWALHRRLFSAWAATAVEDHELRNRQLMEGLGRWGLETKLERFDHHATHAANAYWASGYDRALLVTLDGYGSGNCGGVFVGEEGKIRCLSPIPFPNSLGQHYEGVTAALGFKPGRHEGKIVGLAAYGDPEVLGPSLRSRFDVAEGELRIRAGMNYFYPRSLAQNFSKRDVAAAYQTVLEEVTKRYVEYWIRKTGLRHVAVSGGVHANVKLNQRIREVEGVDSVFVYPNMGDGGCGTGAALLASRSDLRRGRPLENVYFGPSFSEREIEDALIEAKLEYERPSSAPERIAELLVGRKIVARFDGAMEYGPRALGNRSILYSAHDPQVNLWLNHQLGRTEFMPFAPAALASEAPRLFRGLAGCETTAEYMTITFDCTDFMVESCPAAVHVDRTARPQLVSPESNPGFHEILDAYHRRTGIPAIINTSFNMHEEPIVCSPRDAVRAFVEGNIDYLACGPFLVPHPNAGDLDRARSRQAESASI